MVYVAETLGLLGSHGAEHGWNTGSEVSQLTAHSSQAGQ